jgi:hypothetical protein
LLKPKLRFELILSLRPRKVNGQLSLQISPHPLQKFDAFCTILIRRLTKRLSNNQAMTSRPLCQRQVTRQTVAFQGYRRFIYSPVPSRRGLIIMIKCATPTMPVMLAADHYLDLHPDEAIQSHELFEIHRSKISLHHSKAGYRYPTIRLP